MQPAQPGTVQHQPPQTPQLQQQQQPLQTPSQQQQQQKISQLQPLQAQKTPEIQHKQTQPQQPIQTEPQQLSQPLPLQFQTKETLNQLAVQPALNLTEPNSLLSNLRKINQKQTVPAQTQNQQVQNPTQLPTHQTQGILNSPAKVVPNQISAQPPLPKTQQQQHQQLQLQPQPPSQLKTQPLTGKLNFQKNSQQSQNKNLSQSMQYNASNILMNAILNVDNPSEHGKTESTLGLTTTHPCLNPNVSKCFAMISEQMNRTEEMLRMANKTLGRRPKPNRQNVESREQHINKNVAANPNKQIQPVNLIKKSPEMFNSGINADGLEVNKNPTVINSQGISSSNKISSPNIPTNTAQITAAQNGKTNSNLSNLSSVKSAANTFRRKRETEKREGPQQTINNENTRIINEEGNDSPRPNEVKISDHKVKEIEFPKEVGEVSSIEEKKNENRQAKAEAVSDVDRADINSLSKEAKKKIRKYVGRKNMDIPIGGMPHRRTKVKGLRRLKSNHNEKASKAIINSDGEVDMLTLQEGKSEGHIQAPQLGHRKTHGEKRRRIEKPRPLKELIHDYDEPKTGKAAANDDSTSKAAPKGDSKATDVDDAKVVSKTEDAPKVDLKSGDASKANAKEDGKFAGSSGKSKDSLKSETSDMNTKAPVDSGGLKEGSKSLPKADKVKNGQKNNDGGTAGSNKYPVLAFSDHPLYRIIFKREAKFERGKLVNL